MPKFKPYSKAQKGEKVKGAAKDKKGNPFAKKKGKK